MNYSFEQGPIRPPSEAGSLLIRFTRNCPWNKCAFCPVYKGRKFSRRSLEEILQDIETIASIISKLKELATSQGYLHEYNNQFLSSILSSPNYPEQFKQVAVWHCRQNGHVFIQDANSLILKAQDLVKAFTQIRQTIPGVKRITSYARSNTVARKSLDEVQTLGQAGLDKIHIGMESGSQEVLKRINKGATPEQHIQAGQKIVQSNISLSEYIMPGLGGKDLSTEHALETARVLNQINPDYIRVRTTHAVPGTPLFEDLRNGTFHPLTDDETVAEIKLFLENLQKIQSYLASDHIMNLLEEVQGKLPEDKEYMLQVINDYLNLSDQERLLFRLGRRGGALRSTKELNNPGLRNRLLQAKAELEGQEGKKLDEIISELGSQYI